MVPYIDTAISSMAWGTSHPGTESMVAALEGSEYDTVWISNNSAGNRHMTLSVRKVPPVRERVHRGGYPRAGQ